MTAKEKLVPELRFPEFTNEWEEKKLAEIADIYSGGTPSTREKSYWNGDILWATPTDVTSIGKYLTNTKRKITKLGLVRSSAKLLPKNSILMTSRATIGEVVINKLPVSTNQGFKSFILKDNNYYEFIYYLLKIYRQFFLRLSTGSTFLELSMSDTKNMKVKIPSIAEQQKIGDFLYRIDQKLELQRKKIKQLKNYKKGMMQRIFDQEIRFKDEDGNEYPEWVEKRLGEVIVEINKRRDRDDLKILSSTIDGVYYQEEYFKNRIASNDTSNYKILTKNQIVFSPQNIWMGNINFNDSIEEGIVSPSYKIFEVINEVNDLYIKYLIKTPKMLYEYKVSSEQGASVVRRNLNMTLFKNIKINLPSFPEQEKIASLLSGIDKKIELEEERLECYEEFKKGLMQRMFI